MKAITRWPAEIVTHTAKLEGLDHPVEINSKVDFDPKTGAPHGVQIWLTDRDGKGHLIDVALKEIGRKTSRVMQRRFP